MKFKDIEDGLWFYNREKTGEGGRGKPLIKEANGYCFGDTMTPKINMCSTG